MMPNEVGAAEPSAESEPTYAAGPPPGAPMRPTGGSPTGPKKRSRGILAVVVIVVAVIVVVAALYLVGVGPFHRSSNPGSASSGATYDEARTQAEQAASPYGSGSWNVLLAAGVDLSSSVLLSTAIPSDLFTSAGITGCVGTAEDSATATTLLAFTGNFSSGESPNWMFFLVNAQGDVATATVVDGQATVWELFQGPGCSVIGTVLGSVSSSAVDSPTAVSAALSDGGTSAGTKFMSAHPGGYLTASVWAGGAWYVDYTTCPASGNGTAGTTYYEYNASVDVTTGKIIGTGTSGTTKCSGLDITGGISNLGARSLSDVLAVGASSAGSSYTSSGTTYFPQYVSVQSVGAGLSAQDLGFKLVSAFLATEPYAFVGLVAPAGCWVGSFSAQAGWTSGVPTGAPSSATACAGSPSLTSPLSAGDQFALVTSSSDSGNLAGTGAGLEINDVSGTYSGVVVAPIP